MGIEPSLASALGPNASRAARQYTCEAAATPDNLEVFKRLVCHGTSDFICGHGSFGSKPGELRGP
jgi:hypothetical protein